MKIYKVVPKLQNKRLLKLWHKAQESQWSAERIQWKAPQRIVSKANKDLMGRVLTPVLMSEQSAFHSASQLIPLLGKANEVEAQYYLATWLVDEARHAELFARMFERIDREPLSVRKLPGAYLFQNKVMHHDVAIWLAGLLVVEVLAKHVMQEFRRLDLDPALSEICDGILKDEARHIGFNHLYVENRIATLTCEDPDTAKAFAKQLDERLAYVLQAAPELLGSLDRELNEIGFETEAVLDRLGTEARQRMAKSIASGERAATDGPTASFDQAAEIGS